MNDSPNYFIVTSHGAAATRWISSAIATNPAVYVAHGKHPLNSISGTSLADEYIKGDTDSITFGNSMEEFYENNSLPAIFKTYKDLNPQADAVGCVHSFALGTLARKMRSLPASVPWAGKLRKLPVPVPLPLSGMAVANILRHPVSFINSHTKLVLSTEDYGASGYKHYSQDLLLQLIHHFPELMLVTCENYSEFIAFAVSCFGVYKVKQDLTVDLNINMPQYQMESLTTDASHLQHFCEELTGMSYNRDTLEYMVQAGPINSHTKQTNIKTPEDIYNSWQPWQQDIARMIIPFSVLKMYEQNGYNVSMLKLAKSNPIFTEATHDFVAGTSLADYLLKTEPKHPGLQAISSMCTPR